MYLENNLRVPGKLKMLRRQGRSGRVDMPAYLMAAREDHIVPWKSAYLARSLLGGETTFVLGASGHIAGVINPASKNRAVTGSATTAPPMPTSGSAATEHKGSWWLHWAEWLKQHGGKEVAARPTPGQQSTSRSSRHRALRQGKA
jgi:polyhydroxyalkanoate synthase